MDEVNAINFYFDRQDGFIFWQVNWKARMTYGILMDEFASEPLERIRIYLFIIEEQLLTCYRWWSVKHSLYFNDFLRSQAFHSFFFYLLDFKIKVEMSNESFAHRPASIGRIRHNTSGMPWFRRLRNMFLMFAASMRTMMTACVFCRRRGRRAPCNKCKAPIHHLLLYI